MVRVKICGLTNGEDVSKAVFYGAWAVGFIFYKKSPRYISPSKARKIIEELPPFVTPVGVFVDQSERAVREICGFARLTTVQFHGDETAVYCKRFKDFKIIKAFRINEFFPFETVEQYKVDAYLFDTFKEGENGGTGQAFDWKLINKLKFKKPVILSGGLNAENVAEAMKEVSPFAVDVSSGMEKQPGIKDPRLIRSFMDVVKFNNQ